MVPDREDRDPSSNSYDKEKAIADWRGRLRRTGTLFEGDLDELESHLRDELDALEEVELTGAPAFEQAEKRLGEISLLAAEFAKVNPLLAWRTALFYLASGCFFTLVGIPIYFLVIHAVMNIGLALHISVSNVSHLTFATAIGFPALVFTVLFVFIHRHAGKRFWPFESPVLRVLLLTGGALTMLVGRLCIWPLHRWEWHKWGTEAVNTLASARDRGDWWVSIAGPVVMGLFAVHLARTFKKSSHARSTNIAPLLWIAVGAFIAIIRTELHYIVHNIAIFFGRVTHLSSDGLVNLSWLSAFLCPLLLVVAAWGFLRFRAPSPDRLVQSAKFALAIGVSAATAIVSTHCAKFFQSPYGGLDDDTLTNMFLATTFANIIVALVIPVAVGALALRLYRSSLRPDAAVCS